MERASFCTSLCLDFASASLLLCRPCPTRCSDLDSHGSIRLSINGVEGHGSRQLHIACFALRRSDSSSCQELLCSSSSASVPGFAHSSLRFFCCSKARHHVCQCSAKPGSSISEPASLKHLPKNLDSADSHDARDSMSVEGDGIPSKQLLPEGNGTMDVSAENWLDENTIHDETLAKGEGNQEDSLNSNATPTGEGTSIPMKEPIYEVLEVKVGGSIVTKKVSRRLLLKTSGLRLRDIRSVDPSLWVTNAAPALLIRDHAVLLNLGSLRAIASADSVLLFDCKSVGATAFLDLLLQRLNPDPGVPAMPFELEVVEAALLSRTQRLERRLMEVEPRVLSLLKVLPNRMTANILEELRLSKQALVELGSKANALRQMLLELLESPQEIRRMTIIGRRCTINKVDGHIECVASADEQLAHDEEEEMEMLLENYLQRCESCHGQAERLLNSAKEMEDSIAVNLSSRRLEVGRLELLLQVGTFCSALGALVAGIFGMNLKSYLEDHARAFWLTSAGIILGGIVLFFLMYNHLKQRKIL